MITSVDYLAEFDCLLFETTLVVLAAAIYSTNWGITITLFG